MGEISSCAKNWIPKCSAKSAAERQGFGGGVAFRHEQAEDPVLAEGSNGQTGDHAAVDAAAERNDQAFL